MSAISSFKQNMIDINTYRRQIGCFNHSKMKKSVQSNLGGHNNNVNFYIKGGVGLKSGFLVYKDIIEFYITGNGNLDVGLLVYYVYFVLFIMFLTSNIILSKHFSLSCDALPSFISYYSNFGLPDLSAVHVRLAFFVLISFVLNNLVRGCGPLSGVKSLTPAKIFLDSTPLEEDNWLLVF